MADFSTMRSNMVDCQIRTNGVINNDVLDVFENTPRELFVPQDKRNVAYTDTPTAVAQDRTLMDPMTHARLVEALAPKSNEVALDVAAATGYSTAVLAPLVSTVLVLETRQANIDKATKILDEVGVYNVAFLKGRLQDGAPDQAPYDVIFMNGAVAETPSTLIDQLAVGGRLAVVEQPDATQTGQAVLYKRVSEDNVQRKVLFEASLPYVPNFEPEERFVF